MGSWGIKAFENDTACDWAYGLEVVDDLSLIESTLDKALAVGGEYLEAPDAEEALAAIETIAKLLGKSGQQDSYTEAVDVWVRRVNISPQDDLINKASRVIERIRTAPSELLELWAESEESVEWKNFLADLLKRIK